MIILNEALAERLEKSEINYMFYSKTMPWGLFNNVKGTIEKELIDDVIRFYKEREREFEIQIIPSKVDQEVLKLLSERGFYQSGFHTTMYCESREMAINHSSEIHIRELQEDEFDSYAEIHCRGTGISLAGKPYVAENNRV